MTTIHRPGEADLTVLGPEQQWHVDHTTPGFVHPDTAGGQ